MTAAAARTRKARLAAGAVLPAFNNPLEIAGEAGMLDAISGGRLELGFARAFLPLEFAQFGVSRYESVARFDEGLAQVRLLSTTAKFSPIPRMRQKAAILQQTGLRLGGDGLVR